MGFRRKIGRRRKSSLRHPVPTTNLLTEVGKPGKSEDKAKRWVGTRE